MRIAFMDLDGVLLSKRTGYRYFDDECVDRINHVLKVTNSYLVITSAIRIGKNIDEVKDICDRGIVYGEFPEGYKKKVWLDCDRIVGTVPDIPAYTKTGAPVHSVKRGEEISEWIKANDYITEFIVIDDDNYFIQPHNRRLVKVDPILGFSASNAMHAIQMLS